MATPSPIPTAHRAGTTIAWTFSLASYPPADGWTAVVHLTPPLTAECATAVQITASATGTDWLVEAPAAQSEVWAPGTWTLDIEASKDGEVYVPVTRQLRIEPAIGKVPTDLTALKTQLAAVDAAIAAVVAGQGIKEMRIQTALGEREMSYMTLSELRSHRAWLADEIARKQQALGLSTHNKRGWRPIRTYVK